MHQCQGVSNAAVFILCRLHSHLLAVHDAVRDDASRSLPDGTINDAKADALLAYVASEDACWRSVHRA